MENEIQNIVADFINRRPTMREHDTPHNVAYHLRGEIEEMLAELWTEEPTPEHIEKVKSELADIVIYCATMASVLGLDMEYIVKEKLAINEKRFPEELFKDGDFMEAYTARKRELKEWKDDDTFS